MSTKNENQNSSRVPEPQDYGDEFRRIWASLTALAEQIEVSDGRHDITTEESKRNQDIVQKLDRGMSRLYVAIHERYGEGGGIGPTLIDHRGRLKVIESKQENEEANRRAGAGVTGGESADGFGGRSIGVMRFFESWDTTNLMKLIVLVIAVVLGFLTWALTRSGGWGDQIGDYYRAEQEINRTEAEARLKAADAALLDASQPDVQIQMPEGADVNTNQMGVEADNVEVIERPDDLRPEGSQQVP